MRKILAIVVILAVALSLGVTVVSAAPSAEAEGVVSAVKAEDAKGENVSIEVYSIDEKVSSTLQTGLANVKKETGNKDLKIVDHFEVEVEGKPTFPITVTLHVLGIKKDSVVYVLAENDPTTVVSAPAQNTVKTLQVNSLNLLAKVMPTAKTTVETIKPTVEDGKITFKLEKGIKKLAIVTDVKTAEVIEKENNVKSPQTADKVDFVVFAMMIAVVALLFVSKKVKA